MAGLLRDGAFHRARTVGYPELSRWNALIFPGARDAGCDGAGSPHPSCQRETGSIMA